MSTPAFEREVLIMCPSHTKTVVDVSDIEFNKTIYFIGGFHLMCRGLQMKKVKLQKKES